MKQIITIVTKRYITIRFLRNLIGVVPYTVIGIIILTLWRDTYAGGIALTELNPIWSRFLIPANYLVPFSVLGAWVFWWACCLIVRTYIINIRSKRVYYHERI